MSNTLYTRYGYSCTSTARRRRRRHESFQLLFGVLCVQSRRIRNGATLFSNGSRATKTQTQVRKPQRAHTHVKILIPLPFKRTASTAIERQSDPKGTQSYLSSKIYLCQICMRCVYFVPAPRVATISKSICVESYSSL